MNMFLGKTLNQIRAMGFDVVEAEWSWEILVYDGEDYVCSVFATCGIVTNACVNLHFV